MRVALMGKMRTGKDTIAEYLIWEYGFTRFAFGDGIRKVCRELFPEQMQEGLKPRRLLQGIGQDMRKYEPDIWVNLCFNEIKKEENTRSELKLSKLLPVITDLRQPNEYKRCKEEGFIFIKVETDDNVRLQRMNSQGDNFTLEDLNHETEQHIDTYEYDYVIKNNGYLEDLHMQVDYIMSEIINESSIK